ncbi:uncharacterized protein LOC120350258 [Nilaparvata lugens]|uniref:uncharacterized protein LOC120350258 n=1 Tax=Nilaparvata lugens TaxID=108931 RepID=UPI00193E8A29|nr:uncharacterized protein LOC120350258 [Nilaparvata lugens]
MYEIRGADANSDHHLMVATFAMKIMAAGRKFVSPRMRFDEAKLRNEHVKTQFALEVKNRFDVLMQENDERSVDSLWMNVREAYLETSKSVLGKRDHQKKDWMSEQTWDLIQLRKVKKANINTSKTRLQKKQAQDEYSRTEKEVKKCVRRDHRKYVDDMAARAEQAARIGDSKELYRITRALSKRSYRNDGPVKSKEGQLLTSKDEQLERWREHFMEIFNRQNEIEDHEEIEHRDGPVVTDIEWEVPTKDEVKKAISEMKNGKAPGSDNISPDVLKVDVETSADILYPLITKIWEEERVPAEWKTGTIMKIPRKVALQIV